MPIGSIFGGLIGAAGSIFGAGQTAAAANNAAQLQAGAANNATALQASEFQNIQQQLAPFLGTGTNANASLAGILGIGGGGGGTPAPSLTGLQGLNLAPYNLPAFTQGQFQQSPGYQYQLQQANQAVRSAATPGQGTLSGATLKGLQSNATGLANQDWYNALNQYTNNYNNAYSANNQNAINTNTVANQNTLAGYNASNNNYWNVLSALSGLSGSGQNAAAQLGGFGTTAAYQEGQNTIGAGNALAAGKIASTSAITGGVNSLINNLNAPNAGNNNSLLSSLVAQFTGGGAGSGSDNQDYSSGDLGLTGTQDTGLPF